MKLFLIFILILLVRLIIGFISFLIDAKLNCYDTFNDSTVKADFMCCILLGPLAFIVLTGICISDGFNIFMNWLLKKINKTA